MPAVYQEDSLNAATEHLYTLMNFSTAVLRAEDLALQHAMLEYQQFLLQQHRLASKAA